jgi:hypothetical protein
MTPSCITFYGIMAINPSVTSRESSKCRKPQYILNFRAVTLVLREFSCKNEPHIFKSKEKKTGEVLGEQMWLSHLHHPEMTLKLLETPLCHAWWHSPTIPALGRLRQEDPKFQVSQSYKVRPYLIKWKSKTTKRTFVSSSYSLLRLVTSFLPLP